MISNKNLLILTASNGENLKLAKRFSQIATRLGASPELLDLTTINLPLYNPRNDIGNTISDEITALHSKLMSMPRWIICAPEYNGSIPPVLSNAIAWLSVQSNDFRLLFNGRPIAIASFSGGGCMELLVSMRIQLSHLGAQVVGRQLASNSRSPAKDESIEDLIQRLLQMEVLKLQG